MRLIKFLKKSSSNFFQYYPAWGFALCALLGTLLPFFTFWIFLPFLWIKASRLYFLCLLFSLGIVCIGEKKLPSLDQSYALEGIFTPENRTLRPSFFNQNTLISGVLKTKESRYKISLLEKPSSQFSHHVCFLKLKIEPYNLSQKIAVLEQKPVGTLPLLYRFRKALTQKINELTYLDQYPEASQLLSSLISGKIESKLLNIQFKDHGLAHLLALSGFHLNLILAFCAWIFAKVLRIPYSHLLGVAILSVYVLYTGSQPSIIRAYSMTLFGAIYSFFSISPKPLHLFSLSLLFSSLWCHQEVTAPSFILTFIATLSLILFQEIWRHFLNYIPPPVGSWEKGMFAWLKIATLQVFVFVMTAPTILFFFAKIHLTAIFYNLFFPAIIGLFMMLGVGCSLLKILLPQIAQSLQSYLYLGMDLCLECIKRPVSKQSGFIEMQLPLALFILYLAGLFTILFVAAKKNQAL